MSGPLMAVSSESAPIPVSTYGRVLLDYPGIILSNAVSMLLLYLCWRLNHHKPPSAIGSLRHQRTPRKLALIGGCRSSQASVVTVSTEDDDTTVDSVVLADLSLQEDFPHATEWERRRFLTARSGNLQAAAAQLGAYLNWIEEHEAVEKKLDLSKIKAGLGGGDDDDDDDVLDWRVACAVARKASRDLTADGDEYSVMPRVVRSYRNQEGSRICDKDGFTILHMIPALMDIKLAKTTTYALATALYINRKLDRSSQELISVCMDLRAGRGWPSVHAVRLIPFIQSTIRLLLALFPERLHRCLVYPLPSKFVWIWDAVRRYIDENTRDKILLLPGKHKIDAPPPRDHMNRFLSPSVTEFLEASRVADFAPTTDP